MLEVISALSAVILPHFPHSVRHKKFFFQTIVFLSLFWNQLGIDQAKNHEILTLGLAKVDDQDRPRP